MSFSQRLVQQFMKPKGFFGHLAGWTMALRPSNRARNKWTVDLLDLEPHHRVLEIGCGPGFALQLCADKLCKGHITGIDHSDVMIYQSKRRLANPCVSARSISPSNGVENGHRRKPRKQQLFSKFVNAGPASIRSTCLQGGCLPPVPRCHRWNTRSMMSG